MIKSLSMNKVPITTYYAAYHYVELYEEYLHIHQKNLVVIPYPFGIKNDGEKFYFNQITSLIFFKDLQKNIENEEVDEIYSCVVKSKKGSRLKISSFKFQTKTEAAENQLEEYYQFIKEVISRTQPYQPKVYASKGVFSRMDSALPALKIGGFTITGFAISMLLFEVFVEFPYYLFDGFWLGVSGALGISGTLLGFKFFYDKKKNETTLQQIEKSLLPFRTFNSSEEIS